MSVETLAVLFGIVAVVGAFFGFSVRRRAPHTPPEFPPQEAEPAIQRAAITEKLEGALDGVAKAAEGDTPEQDAADLLNRR